MAFKFIILAFFVAAAQGSGDYTSFSYGVSDPHTGDVKSQQETRSGGNVVGQYSLIESDGTRRTVDYAADPHSGFNAVVRKDPAYIGKVAPAVIAAPVVNAAPLSYSGYGNALGLGGYGAYSAPLGYGGYSAAPLGLGAISYGAPAYSAYGAHGYGALGYLGY